MTSPAEVPAGRGGNLVALVVMQAFRMASGLLINVMVMRGLGVEGFGVYGYVLTLVGLTSFASNMGMERLLKREIARDETRAGPMVATGLAATALLSLATGVFIVVWTLLVDGRAEVVGAGALAAVALAIQSIALVPVSAFHAVRRMGLGVGPNAVGRVVLVLATAAFLWAELGVMAVFAAQILDATLTLIIVWRVYVQRIGTAGMRTAWSDVVDLVRTSVPFGLNALFVSIYLSVDVLLLGLMRDDTEVGIYRGAVMLLSLFPVVADTLSTGLYPRMARHLGHPDRAGAEMRFAARILLAISIPAAVGGVLTAEPVMVFLGGPAFAVSALPFMIMAPLLPLRYLNNGFGMALSALDQQEDRTRGAILAAVVNVGLNLVMIPRYGAVGAAAVTLATEVFLIGFMAWRLLPRITSLHLGETLLRVGVPAAVMAGVIAVLPPTHVLVTIAAGVGVYAVGALATGALRRTDLRDLRSV